MEEEVVLEDMGQLVLDESQELGIRKIHRKHHAVAHRRSEGAHPFRDEVQDDVVLLEGRVGGIENQRRRFLDLEVEGPGQLIVGALGEGDDLLQQVRFRLVVVDVEMRRVVDHPVEVSILDLVLAEAIAVLGACRKASEEHCDAEDSEDDESEGQPASEQH